MKKTFLALLLVLALVLPGCHGARDMTAFQVPEGFDESRSYEITFWAKNDTNLTQVEIYEKAIGDFQTLYPNITVNLRLYTDYGRIYNDVITNISTGTTPNVCITYPDHIATYITGADTVVALDELLTDPRYGLGGSELKFEGPGQGQIVDTFLQECRIDGSYYAIPYMRSTEACYVNKTFVEKLGFALPEKLTWDFVWQVSEAAMEKDAEGNFKVNGQKVLIPFIYKSTDNMMIQMLRQKQGGYSTATGEILIFNDTTKELLQTVSQHALTRAFSTFKISSYPANYLNAGQCIFAVDSTAGATWMGSDAPLLDISEDKLVRFETAVMEIPQFDTENPQMISQGPSMCVFNKEDPQEVLASWLFAQYMLTDEVQLAYAGTEGYVPVTEKAQQSAAYQDYLSRSGEDNGYYYNVKIDAAKLMLRNIDNTFVTPVFNGSASLRDAAGQMIENVTKSMRRNETVDDGYFEKLYQDMNSLYRLDQTGKATDGKTQFGALPGGAVVLLVCLVLAWALMGAYVGAQWYKNKKFTKKH
ncbi:MAG: extracellular solute-binding protein [Oscillospiraceae bacterium]|nr:extracellular solute-binding protein [Oscillospiraceae bacterium]